MLEKFVDTIETRLSRPLQYYLDICVRCGACADACHFFQASADPAHVPAYRMMLVKRALQDAESKGGDLAKWYSERQGEISDPMIEGLHKAMWECTGCRRCAVFCPFDLDSGLLVSAGRYAMLQEGLAPEMISIIGDAEVSKGEIIDTIKEFYVEQTKELELRLQEEFAPGIEIPVRKKGARLLYVPLVGEHAIVPVAKIFHAAGEDWTLSLFTATNHSFFTGDMAKAKETAHWIVQEARDLGVQGIVYPECGHATRTLLSFFDDWYGDELAGIERIKIEPLVAGYLSQGKIQVRPNTFDVPLTYHDPCNLGRNAGFFDDPRHLIRSTASDFRELDPNRELNWCCGGGGGLIAAPEMKDVRMKGGLPKVAQIRQSGAKWVVTACENCKTQLADLNEHYDLGVEIKGVVDLVAEALVMKEG